MNLILKRLVLKNFKKVRDQTYDFTDFDLLVGQNNSGKSTILQAIAIWQYCIEEFVRRGGKNGSKGIQMVLPNFTALPLPEFNLLWTDKVDRQYSSNKNGDDKKNLEYVLVEIGLTWRDTNGEDVTLGVNLRYQSPQSVYAIPVNGWKFFSALAQSGNFPKIVYVPPFSGLEPSEIWMDDGNIRQKTGKAQPGAVLRNLLYRVIDKSELKDGKTIQLPLSENSAWKDLTKIIREWFGVDLTPPDYEKGVSTEIKCLFKAGNGKEFDIISGGSGFHQVLTLLAFYYGYQGITTLLLDEPDAHMHVNLQRKVINYFRQQKNIQFFVATHAEEFIKGVDANAIISVMADEHRRINSVPDVITALSDVDNLTVTQTTQSPFILYVEGEDDERILSSWAKALNKETIFFKYHIYIMGGTTKRDMKERAEKHFKGLRQINPKVKKVMVFDHDSEETAFNLSDDNPVLSEWKRKNIENYLLVPDAWKRTVLDKLNLSDSNEISKPVESMIDDFFEGENLTLPKNNKWATVKANIFEEVNGKKILFERDNALFHQIRSNFKLIMDRSSVAKNMLQEEIHIDVQHFFEKLQSHTIA